MPIENAQYIHELNATNPVPGDAISGADDHLRNIKASIKNSFPNVQGIVNASQDDLNLLSGKSGSVVAADIGALHGSQDAAEADTATFRGMINGITGTTVSGDGIIGVTNGTVTYDDANAASTGVPFNANVTLSHKAKAAGLSNISATTGNYLSSVSFDAFGHVSAVAVSQVVPAGVIVMWSGAVNAVPAGWVLCNGQNNTPDLRDRFVVGAGSAYVVIATGGANSVTLTTDQIPTHNHGDGTLATSSAGSHRHGLNANNGGSLKILGSQSAKLGGIDHINSETFVTSHNGYNMMQAAGSHTHNITGSTANTGGGNSHENRPPYLALAYIMKT